MKRSYRRLAHWGVMVTLLAVVLLAGCHSWYISTVTPEQLILDEHPKVVRVERVAGERVDLALPAVRNDTLYGRVAGHSVSVPIREIRFMLVKRGDVGKSVLLGVGMLEGAFVAFLGIVAATWFR